jgi:hypothetical protein
MLFDIMGFGKAPDEPVPMADVALAGVTFRAPLMLLADDLGTAIDDFVYHREVAVADKTTSRPAASRQAPSQPNASATPPSGRPSRTDRRAHHPARRRPGAGLADGPRLEGDR